MYYTVVAVFDMMELRQKISYLKHAKAVVYKVNYYKFFTM